MLDIYFTGHAIQLKNSTNVFTRHDRKWASFLFLWNISGLQLHYKEKNVGPETHQLTTTGLKTQTNTHLSFVGWRHHTAVPWYKAAAQ